MFFFIFYSLSYFYPRSPCGERPTCRPSMSSCRYFYPRSPCGERLHHRGVNLLGFQHFYPRSPCGERRVLFHALRQQLHISIHALLAESDACGHQKQHGVFSISIHALLAESDLRVLDGSKSSIEISIHALLAESDTKSDTTKRSQDISIHALLAESDIRKCQITPIIQYFYPRSPCGERPWQRGSRVTYVEISIHALLAESDARNTSIAGRITSFLSTLSLRRATLPTALRTPHHKNFYPRSPCGERPRAANCQQRNHHISIHALLAESDCITDGSICFDSISIHALLAESDIVSGARNNAIRISIHALLAESD